VSSDGAVVTINGGAEATYNGVSPHIKSFLYGLYHSEDDQLNTSVTRLTQRSDIVFDAIPLPKGSSWRIYPGPFSTAQKRNLLLQWEGDSYTERYRVYHSLLADYSDAVICGTRSINSEIIVVNTSGTSGVLAVTGVDGPVGPEGNYSINVTRLTAEDDITITVVDNIESTTSEATTWDGNSFSFGKGLMGVLTEPWPDLGTTVFVVTAEPDKSYLLRNPSDATHYFKVRALRGADGTYADSAWESKTIVNPPGPVSGIDVEFVSTSSVNITFTMPADADIAGFHIFVGENWKNGNYVPHWHPKVTSSAVANESVTAVVGGLAVDTTYWFYIRAFDSSGMDDETTNVSKFFLSSTAVSYGDVEAPYDIVAEATDLNEVTITVTTDKRESSVVIYSDGGTGTIDYTTAYATLESSTRVDQFANEFGTYTTILTGITAGDYLFGARCEVNGASDGNTDIYDDVTVYGTALTAPSDLTITEVPTDG